MTFGEGLPEVSAEDLAKTPESVRALLVAMAARIVDLEARVAALEAENAALRERLGLTSRNSSKPPSSDGPAAPPRTGPPTGRKRGGQPGHRKHSRALVPAERVDALHDLRPSACGRCHAPLTGSDPDPLRLQQVEVPAKLCHVTEWRLHRLTCAACGGRTRAAPPPEARAAFGPRLQALTALLVGRFKLSHREVPELLREVFGVAMSDGAVTDCTQAVSTALDAPVAQARQAARTQAVAHADETGWRLGRRRAWLWVMATVAATFFLVRRRRNTDTAMELLGDFEGVLTSDRWSAYDFFDPARRQLCWAHLVREWRRIAERGGADAAVGEALQRATRRLFRWWHRARDGTEPRARLEARVRRLRPEVRRLLRQGARDGSPKTAATCRDVLAHFESLWTFAWRAGVEPTNNEAERQIRPAVLWRKGSFGNDSERGATFAERILTVVATLRQHERPLLPFLVEALRAYAQRASPPSLLPATA